MIQTGTTLRNRTESSLRKSSSRSLQKPKDSTETTRKLGPFTVTKRVTNTTYQIQDDRDPTILETVHRNHLVEYCLKKETLPPMIEEYRPMDKRHDDFYEKLMEQRIQKINNPEQSNMEDSFAFPIESLRTAPVTLPPKGVSNTCSDSGVNNPHALSPAIPVNLVNSQSYLIPSTSRMNPPSRPLTPIQQFIKNSQTSKAKEPKNNRSLPDHPDLHLTRLRTLIFHFV